MAMEKEKQFHFVLIHGACHGAWCWYKVATLLGAADGGGHKVTALDMAASGIHPRQLDEVRSLPDYFEPLTDFMDALPPEDKVVLVGHSLGGSGVAMAMEKFPEKIAVAVFVTALMPGPLLDELSNSRQIRAGLDLMDSKFAYNDGPDKTISSSIFGPQFLSSMLYNLSPPEDLALAKLLGRPTLFGEKSLETVFTQEKYGSVPRVYIITKEDKVITEDTQRWILNHNPADEMKEISGADHMVMFSKPLELSSCLLEIAKTYCY